MNKKDDWTLTDEEMRERVAAWHESVGGHARLGYKHHALRLLHEVVELCLADGATDLEISYVIMDEIDKSKVKGEYGCVLNSNSEEVGDVGILLDIYCHYAGINPTFEKAKKHAINLDRSWRADDNGVLWRRV